MKNSVKRFLDYISSGVSTVKLPITRVILFGSYARGDELVSSDIDLAIVCDEILNSHSRALLFEFLEGYSQEMNYSLFWTSEANLTTNNPKDANYYISKEGIVLYEKGT